MTAHDDIQTIRTVGFIGLGSMGLPMALNLLKAGFVVRGHSRSAERTRLFTEAGGIDAPDLGSILEKADAVITMVPDGNVVEELMEAPDGIAARAPRGCLMLDMSTIAPDQARGLAARCRDLGIDFLDAPVSGGTKGARDGSLTIMVGGEEATFAKAPPVRHGHHHHPHGTGGLGPGHKGRQPAHCGRRPGRPVRGHHPA